MARKEKAREPSPDTVEDEILTDPADSIDPYAILSIEKTATQDQVKIAYRKAALKHHPDKAQSEKKDEANKKFQEIATAYAILSDEKRRRRYDTTGNTAESLDDEDFDWVDFFREQSAAVVNGDMIDQIKKEYQGSEEERDDVLQAYEEGEGDMDMVYEMVMCSNVVDDDKRFRNYIDQAIKNGKVEEFDIYAKETKDKKRGRVRKAKAEAQEAMELAEELGIKEKLFGQKQDKKGTKGKKAGNDEDALRALIQQRQKGRSENFFDNLEAKYGGGKAPKRKATDEPPEELFQKNAKKGRNRK